jgi:succinoglycan biosynthesis transport protein ExoP
MKALTWDRRDAPEPGEENMLAAAFRALLRRKLVAFAAFAAIFAAGVLVALWLPTRYTANATLALDMQRTRALSFANIDPDPPREGGFLWPTVSSEMARLTSPSLAAKVVDRLDLASDPEFNPTLPPEGAIAGAEPSLVSALWTSLHQREQALIAAASQWLGQPSAHCDAGSAALRQCIVDAFATHVKATADQNSGLINLRVTSKDAGKALKIANALVDEFASNESAAKVQADMQALDWLTAHVREMEDNVLSSERRLEEFRAKAHLIENKKTGESVMSQQVAELNAALVQAETAETNLRSHVAQIDREIASHTEDSSVPDVLKSNTITALRNQETTVARTVAEAQQAFGPRYPGRQAAEAQLAGVHRKLAEEMRRIRESMQSEANAAHSGVLSLRQQLGKLQAESGTQNVEYVTLRDLERKADADRQIYDTFLSRIKELTASLQLERSDLAEVSPPVLPLQPSFPRKMQIAGLSAIVALIAAVFAAAWVERAQRGFLHARQIDRRYDGVRTSVLPLLPRGRGTRPAYVGRIALIAYLEGIRCVFAEILGHRDSRSRSVLVTSAVPGEGKTTLALALARFAAEMGKRVVIVDCDLARPALARRLRLGEGPGLLDLLSGRSALSEAIQSPPQERLQAIAPGALTHDVPGIVATGQMRALGEKLKEHFDLVVFDCGPILGHSDGLAVANAVDCALLAVHWGRTPVQAVDDAMSRLIQTRARICAALTQVSLRRYATYDDAVVGYYASRLREAGSNAAIIGASRRVAAL